MLNIFCVERPSEESAPLDEVMELCGCSNVRSEKFIEYRGM